MLAQILVTPDLDENENMEYSRFEILQKAIHSSILSAY